MLDLFEDAGLTFAPDSPLLGPTGGQIDAVNGVDEHAGQGVSTMGDGIGFEKPWAGLIPLVGLNGDVLSEKGTGFGGSPAPFLVLSSDRAQEPIESGRGNGLEGVSDLGRDRAEELTISGEP